MVTELNDVLDRLQQGPPQLARHVMDATDNSGDERDVSQRKKELLSKRTYRMKKAWYLLKLRDSLWLLWLGLQIQWRNPVNSVVNSVGMMCWCWPTGHLNFRGTIRAPSILQWTRDCVWRQLVGGCSISVENRSQRRKLSVNEPELSGHQLCDVTENIFLWGFNQRQNWCCGPADSHSG